MNKRNILTVMGIALSFIIATGGWILTSGLIELRSTNLMTATGVTPIAMPTAIPPPPQNDNEYDYPYIALLTEHEIVSILQNLAATGREIPHEPTQEQINMEQAIQIAENWIVFLVTQLNWFEEIFYFENAIAQLTQNRQRDGSFLLPSAYSFWTVRLSNRHLSVIMFINAVEGQVWKTEITVNVHTDIYTFSADEGISILSPFTPLEVEGNSLVQILDEFMLVIGLPTNTNFIERTDPNTNTLSISKVFANGSVYAAVSVDLLHQVWGDWLSFEHRLLVKRFSMYLDAVDLLFY